MAQTVLLVDDDVDVRDALGEMLEQEGYDVVPANDGIDALDKLATHPETSLIILDLMMPRMNGLDFLQHVEKEPRFAHIPVLVVTASSGYLKVPAKKAGRRVLTKPVDVDELLSEVRHLAAAVS